MLTKHIRQVKEILTKGELNGLGVVLLVNLSSSIFEALGVVSVLPFISVAANPDTINDNPALSWLYGYLNFSNTSELLLFLGGLSFITLLTSVAVRAFATYFQLRFIFELEHSISARLFSLYLKQPYSYFLERHSAELSKTVLSEVNQVTQGVVTPLMQLFTNSVLALIMTGITLWADFKTTLILLVILGLAYITSHKISNRYLERIAKKRFHANQKRFHTVSESFGAIKDLKVMGQEESFAHLYENYSDLFARFYVQAQVVAQAPRFFLEVVVFGGVLAFIIYYLSGSRPLVEVLPTLSLMAFAGYRLIPALQMIFGSFVNLRFQSPSLSAVHDDLNKLCLEPLSSNSKPFHLRSSLVLKDLSYAYPGSKDPVICNLDLELKAGSTVAIVGSTGGGKTTLVDLILGLLEPDKGCILIDDIKLCEENRRNWQSCVGYVSQQVFLLDDSINSNIAFGDKVVDKQRIESSARFALIHEFVKNQLPDGYETRVGEKGVRLSGGQRQRLGIARALYRRPDLLVLDESTSALDMATEREFMKLLEALHGKTTILMIAHRMSTVRQCDQIVVLDQGKLKAQGTFDELMKTCSLFRELNQNS